MSSNIKAKNLIYQLKKYDALPYQNSQMVDYSSNNQYVNAVNLNNTYGQCIDNDLFIAKQLKKSIDSSIQVGPLLATSTAQIDALPDGTKIFDSEYDARIMQKRVASLQDALRKCGNSLFSTIDFIQLVGQNTALVCTPDASYLAFLDEIGNNRDFSPSITVRDVYGNNVAVTATLNDESTAINIFAATTSGFNEYALYRLKSNSTTVPSKDYSFVRICPNVSQKITSISYNNINNSIAFATSTTLYLCKGSIDSMMSFQAIATFSDALGTGSICAIHLTSSYVLVFTTSGNIYHVDVHQATQIGFMNPSLVKLSQDNIVAYDIVTVDGAQYFATSKGLCNIVDGVLHVIDKRFANETRQIVVDDAGTLWFVDAAGQLLSYIPGKAAISSYSMSLDDGTPLVNATKIYIICDVKVIVTKNNGVFYEKNEHDFVELSGLNDALSATHLVVQSQSQDSAQVYAAGNDISSRLAVASATITRAADTDDYSVISGLSSVYDALSSDAHVFSMITVKYGEGNKQHYAFVNYSNNTAAMINIASNAQVWRWGAQIRGVMQKSDDKSYAYVILDDYASIIKFDDNGNISKNVLFTIKFNDKTLVDYQFDKTVNNTEQFLVTLKRDSSNEYELARMVLDDSSIYLKESVSLGISSNVVKYNDKYVAIEKTDDIVHGQVFDFSTKMTDYEDNATNVIQSIVALSSAQIVDNNYVYLSSQSTEDMYTYRREDHIVPGNGNNISVLRSTCTYNNDESAFTINTDNQTLQEIPNTSGIKSISHRYAGPSTDYSVDIMCVISSFVVDGVETSSAIYVRSTSIIDQYDNPTRMFTYEPAPTSCVIHPDIKQAILMNKGAYNRTTSTSAAKNIYRFSAFEISLNNELSLYTYATWGTTTITLSSFSSENILSDFSSMMLARSSEYAYVLGKPLTNDNQYQIYQLSVSDPNPNQRPAYKYRKIAEISGDIALSDVMAFTCTYSNAPNYDVYHDNTARLSVAFDMSASNDGEVLHVIFKNKDYAYNLSGVQILGESDTLKPTITQWDSNYNVKSALALRQTPNTFDNLMFANTLFGDNTPSTLFYLDDRTGIYSLDDEQTIDRVDNTPSQISVLDWVGKDSALDSVMLMQGNNLSIVHNNNISLVQMPDGSSKPQLLQCYDKSFGDQQNILFSDKYASYISSVTPNSIVMHRLTSYPMPNAKVLNISDSNKYPYISYLSTVNTIRYDSYQNLTTEVGISSSMSSVPCAIQKCALNALNYNEMIVANKPAYSPMTLYRVSFENSEPDAATDVISAVASFSNLVADIVFPSNFACLAYSIATGNDPSRPICIALDQNNNQVAISDASQLEQLVAQCQLGHLSYRSGVYTLYGSHPNHGAFALSFSSIGRIHSSLKSNAQADDIASTIVPMQDNTYIVQCLHNIFSYDASQQEIESLYASSNGAIGMLDVDDASGHATYYASVGNEVISSSNLQDWSHVMHVGTSADYDALVTSFSHFNEYVVLCNKKNSDDDGLFYTCYMYQLVDNTSPFTAESAFYMYNDNISAIDEFNEQYMSTHIDTYHLSSNSNVNLLDTYMDTNFSLQGFIKKNSDLDVQNDYIDQIVIGNSSDNRILAYATNSANSSQQKKIDCNYIAKCWKSGFTELYIYLPTTYTYYIPHVEGASQCSDPGQVVEVNGRRIAATVNDNATAIRISIASSLFTIGTLLENTIKANSLPLHIHKDDVHNGVSSDAMFHSFVCPSVAQELNREDVAWGYQSLNYYCFGSDAQAIKLAFMNDASQAPGKKYKTIVYHANGGFLPDFAGMKSLTQRIYEGSAPAQMYWAVFQKNGAFFVGWSQSANAVNNDDAYTEGTVVSYDMLQQQTLNLYACWISYEFGVNDTQITISNSTPKNYTIAEITIDPNAKLQDNMSLGNTMIVDYGE